MHGVGVDGDRHFAVSKEEKQAIRKELNVLDDEYICLCTGELNANKNQMTLIQMMPKLKEKITNFKLWLAGNGPLKEELEKEIERLNLSESVKLLGYQTQIEKFVRASDIVCSASKREGLPFNIIEAMLAKRPVVASVNRGHKELIKNNENGFITNQQDEFIDYIVRLYEDKALYNQIVDKALQYAKSYTIKQTMKEFKTILGVVNE